MNTEHKETVIRTEKVELVDQAGQVRATLGFQIDGEPMLLFLDQQGKKQLGIGIGRDGLPGLQIAGADGRPLLFLGMESGTGTKLVMQDAASEARIGLGIMPDDGTATLSFFDRACVLRAAVILDLAEGKLGLILRPQEREGQSCQQTEQPETPQAENVT